LGKAEPPRLRELLQRAMDRIDLSFTSRKRGKKREYHPASGQVVFRELSGFPGRGDPSKTTWKNSRLTFTGDNVRECA